MSGLGVVVGFLVAWFARKAGRVGKRVDGIADEVLDTHLDKLRDVVVAKLGKDSALTKLDAEVVDTGEASTRTQARVRLALEEAAEEDSEFAGALERALADLKSPDSPTGDHGVTIIGGVNAKGAGIAIGGVTGGGSVRVERPDPS